MSRAPEETFSPNHPNYLKPENDAARKGFRKIFRETRETRGDVLPDLLFRPSPEVTSSRGDIRKSPYLPKTRKQGRPKGGPENFGNVPGARGDLLAKSP